MTTQTTSIYIVTTTIQGPTDASLGNDDCVIGHAAYFASREVADTFITECVEAWEENSPGLTGGVTTGGSGGSTGSGSMTGGSTGGSTAGGRTTLSTSTM